jgi:hypothetical protein
MSTEHDSRDRALDLIAKMQRQAIERFESEMTEMRTAMNAMAAQWEQSLARLRDDRWVPFDAVSELVGDLAAAADVERSRAAHLSEELETAKRDFEGLRAATLAELQVAREAAVRYRDDVAASYSRELKAVQARNQEIVDAQMLRLVELTRELEAASAAAEQVRTVGEATNREVVAKLSQKVVLAEINLEPVPSRHHLVPSFSAIDSALADSPPVPAWEERLGA